MKLSNRIKIIVVSTVALAIAFALALIYYTTQKAVDRAVNEGISHISLSDLSVFILPFIAVAAGLTLFLSYAINRRITFPLHELVEAVNKVASGDINHRTQPKGDDEFKELILTFNNMADNLSSVHRQLNDEVKKQTDELSEKVQALEDIKLATINILEDLNEDKTKIEESKAKDEAVLDSIGDGLVVIDNDLKVMLVNGQTEELIGWEASEMLGRPWMDFVDPYDSVGKTRIAKKNLPVHVALKKGERSKRDDIQYARKDGTKFPVSVTASPIKLDDEIVGIVVVFRDVTHEKEVDRAKTEFVSLASHQLRTPLSAINWYAEMLIAGDAGHLADDQLSYLKEIYASNQRMVSLVDALLNVSRIDLGTFAVDPEPTNILEICDSVLSELTPQTREKHLNMVTNYAEHVPVINADPKLMRIVLQNLLSNSVKYTPDNGEIAVSVETSETELLIKVADTGYGIPKKQQSKLFTKLFRADNVTEKATDGTGLGLYIVKSIVEQSGGQISFESEEDKGTTFYVRLPLEGMKRKSGSKDLS